MANAENGLFRKLTFCGYPVIFQDRLELFESYLLELCPATDCQGHLICLVS
jgi:hypothetical protein